jgi:antitoxin (DNA-binding transcriptional repressor) of toxin-antitoxin stability system
MVCDHGNLTTVETIAVSKFKATCLAVLQKVKKTGRPILVTRFGQPIAEVVPPRPTEPDDDWIGCMRGRAEITGDVVGPVVADEAWQANRE